MVTTPSGDERRIAISVAPPTSSEVEYFSSTDRTIIITNASQQRLLIEDITLRFASDSAEAAVNVRQSCGWELEPGGVRDQRIQIIPTPLYRDSTNTFDVKVQFRTTGAGKVSSPQHEISPSPSFVVIRNPSTHLGRVFISVKQPEDLDLGRLMTRMARRAGLIPFLKAENPRLSEDIWADVIEPALRNSDAMVVIWTANTDWRAQGVEREIELCRQLGIPEALLLESGISIPGLYAGTDIEYTRFDIQNPGRLFAAAAEALRRRLESRA